MRAIPLREFWSTRIRSRLCLKVPGHRHRAPTVPRASGRTLKHLFAASLFPFASGRTKQGSAFLGRLAEPEEEVWDVRAREPNPALRLFGRFAAPDHFVAFDWRPRSKPWNGREPLHDRHDPEWDAEKAKCLAQWERLFPKHDPVHGGTVYEYVTSNALPF